MTQDGEMYIAYDEVFAVSVSAVGEGGRILTQITLDFENGHYLEIHSEMEGWDTAVRLLPTRFGVEEAMWNEALRVAPDEEPVEVFRCGECSPSGGH